MNLLIIGGTGLLSGSVLSLALEKGFCITMINRGRRSFPKNVELIKSDFRNYTYIKKQLQGRHFDVAIDFLCSRKIDSYESVKLYSMFATQYIYISSCAVYDNSSSHSSLFTEDFEEYQKIWSYGLNKYLGEQIIKKFCYANHCQYTIIRPSITYGDSRIPYGIMPAYGYHWTLVARILADKPIIRWNSGKNCCNIMHVDDFAQAVVCLMGNSKAYNEIFNVCGDEILSYNDILDEISKIISHPIKTIDIPSNYYAKKCPSKAGEILGGRSLDLCCSNNKLKNILNNWNTTIKINQGLRKTIAAYQMNYQKGINWEFDAECDRVISDWCKENKRDTSSYHLKFIDYIGTATLFSKIKYFLEYHRTTFPIPIYFEIKKNLERIKNIKLYMHIINKRIGLK